MRVITALVVLAVVYTATKGILTRRDPITSPPPAPPPLGYGYRP